MTDYQLCPINLNCSQMGFLPSGLCANRIHCIEFADRLASMRVEHQLYKQDERWHCGVCGYNWKSQPQSQCPQAPQYGPNRPYPGVAATKTELSKMGLIATAIAVGVAWNMGEKEFYDLYDLKAIAPKSNKVKLRIFRVCRLWKGKIRGIERTWKGKLEGTGFLGMFYTYDEAQREIAELQMLKHSHSDETYECQPVPGLPDEIYNLARNRQIHAKNELDLDNTKRDVVHGCNLHQPRT